jgi:hypothetical protein
MAKRRDFSYQSGERTGMQRIKRNARLLVWLEASAISPANHWSVRYSWDGSTPMGSLTTWVSNLRSNNKSACN